MRTTFPLVLLSLVCLALAGCNGPVSIPSSSRPNCSWTTSPPADADRLCTRTYVTLSAVLHAAVVGDRTRLQRNVPNGRIARKIALWGESVRAAGLKWVRVVPSYTLESYQPGVLGAEFGIVGKDRAGTIRAPQTVYLRVEHGRQVVVQDQPEQEW